MLVGPGDVTLNADPQLGTLRSTLAEVIAQTLESGAALDTDFTVVNAKGEFPEPELLRERLVALAATRWRDDGDGGEEALRYVELAPDGARRSWAALRPRPSPSSAIIPNPVSINRVVPPSTKVVKRTTAVVAATIVRWCAEADERARA